MARLQYEAVQLTRSVVVRPAGALGTCGWIDGKPWQARSFTSMRRATQWIAQQEKPRASIDQKTDP